MTDDILHVQVHIGVGDGRYPNAQLDDYALYLLFSATIDILNDPTNFNQ